MSWTCFPGRRGPTNRNSNSSSHAQSNREDTGAEPPKAGILSVPWNQAQESTPHEGTPSHPDRIETVQPPARRVPESTASDEEAIYIVDVNTPYTGQSYRLEEAKFTTLCMTSTGILHRKLNYAELEKLNGGREALDKFQKDEPISANQTPPVPDDLLMEPESQVSVWWLTLRSFQSWLPRAWPGVK